MGHYSTTTTTNEDLRINKSNIPSIPASEVLWYGSRTDSGQATGYSLENQNRSPFPWMRIKPLNQDAAAAVENDGYGSETSYLCILHMGLAIASEAPILSYICITPGAIMHGTKKP